MQLRDLKAEYTAQYSGYVKESELNRYLDAGLEFFEARGIELPSEGDFSLWKEQLLTTLKPNTVRHYIREYRKFTDWCRQKGDRSMSLDFEGTQPEVTQGVHEQQTTPEDSASEATQGVHEPDTLEVTEATEATQPVEFVEVEQPEDTPETTHTEGSLEVEPVTETMPEGALEFAEDTPKRRGRKSKPEADRRSVKISIYLTPSLYEGVRLLASARQEDISDVIFSVLDDFVDRNSDKISTVRDFFASLGVIK